MAPRTTRSKLIAYSESAQIYVDKLDKLVFAMVQAADERSAPVTEFAPILADGHEVLRKLWASLRDQL